MKPFEHKILSSGTLGVAEVIDSDMDASDVTQAAEPLLIVTSSIYRTRSCMKWLYWYGGVRHSAIGGNSRDIAFGVLALG